MSNLFDIFSDTFENANGYRPRGSLAEAFLAHGVEGQEAWIEDLQEQIAEELFREEEDARFRYEADDSVSWGDLFGELIGMEPEVPHTHRHSYGEVLP